MKKCDAVIIGYAVNSTSGGYTNSNVRYIDTVGIKYLYSHFYGTYPAEPVAFLQLAAQMRLVGIDTYILDGLLMGYTKNETIERLEKIDTSIYIFSLYESSKDDVIHMMKTVKERNPEAKIVTGGPYVTLCYKELMDAESVIDYAVIGDADFALPALVNELMKNGVALNIPNVIYRDEVGMPITNFLSEIVDMNELQPVARDFVKEIQDKGFSLSIPSSRGCGHAKCDFCYLPRYQDSSHQPKFRYRKPALIVKEIKELIDKYGIAKLTFVDDDFFGDDMDGIAHAKELFELMVFDNINIKFYANARVKTIKTLIEQNLLDLAAKAGLTYLFIGFESYNNEILERYNKDITTNDIDLVCNELKKRNILINPGMITFDYEITPSQVYRNVTFLKSINYYDAFMFTRTLMKLPTENRGMRDNRVKTGGFRITDTEKLYNELVTFRDRAYSLYSKVDSNKIIDETRNKVVTHHYEYFYELYDLVVNHLHSDTHVIAQKHLSAIDEALASAYF